MTFRYLHYFLQCSWQPTICFMIQGYSSAELRSFKKHYTDLLKNIRNPVELSRRLFSADLLSRYMLQTIHSLENPVQQAIKLLDTVEMQISMDPLKFNTFVDELKKDSAYPMHHLCDKLISTCGECDNVCLITSTDQWCSGVAQLKSWYIDPFDDEISSVTLPMRKSSEQRMCVWWNNM